MNGKTDRQVIPESLLQRLTEYLTAKVGLHFAKRNWKDLKQKMTDAMTDFGFDNVEEFIKWLLCLSPTQNQIEILASHLTVGETYFFRERSAFEILEKSLLPVLLAARRKTEKRLRFWSAGCSTGEEAYSLAILIEKLIPDLKNWNVTILATDINTGAIRKAEEGIYSDWSFRDNPPEFKEQFFEKVDGTHQRLLPRIREMVSFAYLNLSDDQYPALQNNTNAMDIIFCRNVMMYFEPRQITLTTERFYRSLLNGGCLIVSPVETSLLTHSPFVTLRIQDSTFYKKDVHKVDIASTAVKPVNSEVLLERAPVETGKYPRPGKPAPYARRIELRKIERKELTLHEEAAVLYRNGQYPEAEEKLHKLISNGGGNQESCILLARILANQGKLEEAHCCCEEAVLADKSNAHLYFLLATILEEQKCAEKAKVAFKKALYLDRNFAMAHFALANLSLRSGKVAEAQKHFSNVSEILLGYKPEDIIPEAEGITAGRLAEIIGTCTA